MQSTQSEPCLDINKKKGLKLEYRLGVFGICVISFWLLVKDSQLGTNTLFNIFVVIGSLGLLTGASDIILEYSVKLSELFGVSKLVIGLTIVSIGTSIPEIFTAIISCLRGVGSLVIGDIYGSYITQLTIFMGLVVLVAPMTVNKKFVPSVKRDGGIMIIALLILTINMIDGILTRSAAIICILLFTSYVVYLYVSSKKSQEKQKKELEYISKMEINQGIYNPCDPKYIIANRENPNLLVDLDHLTVEIHPFEKFKKSLKYIFLVLIGSLLCYVGAHFTVECSTNVAESFGVPEYIIGATIVGFGTGFPELAVSYSAIKRKNYDIAYGNLLGSNIVDPLFSISLGVLAKPVVMSHESVMGIVLWLLPIALIVDAFIILVFSKKSSSKAQGIMIGITFIGLYLIFAVGSFLI